MNPETFNLETISTETISTAAITTKTQYDQTVAFCQAAAEAYYQTGEVLCDDATYDQLMANIAAAEKAHPEWVGEQGAVSGQVAAGTSAGEYEHQRPMLSLDNVFNAEELDSFLSRVTKAACEETISFSVEPKMDGLAISAHYQGGRLRALVTRGDGRHGEVVTHIINRDRIAGLPHQLAQNLDVEIRGEMIMTESDFEEANQVRVANGETPFANPRNAVAGSVRSQDRRYALPLTFIAYDAVGEPDAWKTHSEAMAEIGRLGVATSATLMLADGQPALRVGGPETVRKAVERISELRGGFGFLVDGAVIKANRKDTQQKLGEGSRSPRWATAYKYPAEMALTKLTDIQISMGRTGRVTPVAVLEAVTVGGVQVTSATLNNFEDIARKDVRIGDTVWVRRAGEVIPEVVGPELSMRPADSQPYEAPAHCPRCGEALDKSEVTWRCVTPGCGLREALLYFGSRKAMDIDGLGDHAVEALLDAGLVKSPADLYHLTTAQVSKLDRFGELSAKNLVSAIDASRSRGLERVLTGLGIRHLGRSLSARIVKIYPSMETLMAAVTEKGPDALNQIEGFGGVKARIVADGLIANTELIDALTAAGVQMEAEKRATATASSSETGLTGLRVLVTGAVPGHTRDTAKEAVEAAGGEAVSSVSGRTSVVLAGEGAGGSKLDKAQSLGIPVVDVSAPGEFERICREGI